MSDADGVTVVQDWAGNVIAVLRDKPRNDDTLTLAEAERQLAEAKQQFERATKKSAAPRKAEEPSPGRCVELDGVGPMKTPRARWVELDLSPPQEA
jgi:hypothetical protein